MKKILLLCSLVLIISGCDHPIPRWEYNIKTIDDGSFKQSMDTLGSAGWEMVFARRASDGATYSPKFSYEVILKRPQKEK